MEYVEHTSKVLYNFVRANSSMRALKIIVLQIRESIVYIVLQAPFFQGT